MNNYYEPRWGMMGGHGWSFINAPFSSPILGLIGLLALWTLFWKGLALWHAGRRGQPWWFVILLIVNTLGILEIVYLFAVAKLHFHELFSMGTKHQG
jgi:Family of unknown function (DUF5652)